MGLAKNRLEMVFGTKLRRWKSRSAMCRSGSRHSSAGEAKDIVDFCSDGICSS